MRSGRSRQNLLKGLVNDNRHYARDTVTQGLEQSVLAAKELFIFLLFLAFLSMLHTGVRKSGCAAASGMGRSTQGGETPLKKGASSPQCDYRHVLHLLQTSVSASMKQR